MHPWLAPWISHLTLLHILSAFAFALLHGPTMYTMMILPRERDPARISALLDLSRHASLASGLTIIPLGLTGALLAFTMHIWGATWIWTSAILLGTISGAMSWLAARPLNETRHAVGAAWFNGRRLQPPTHTLDQPALDAALQLVRARLPATLLVGLGGLLALVWLMVARPG